MCALVADVGVAFGFALIVVLAVVVAIVGMLGLIVKIFGALIRFVFGGGAGPVGNGGAYSGERRCRNDGCGHENPRQAVYCGRCGQRLDD